MYNLFGHLVNMANESRAKVQETANNRMYQHHAERERERETTHLTGSMSAYK